MGGAISGADIQLRDVSDVRRTEQYSIRFHLKWQKRDISSIATINPLKNSAQSVASMLMHYEDQQRELATKFNQERLSFMVNLKNHRIVVGVERANRNTEFYRDKAYVCTDNELITDSLTQPRLPLQGMLAIVDAYEELHEARARRGR